MNTHKRREVLTDDAARAPTSRCCRARKGLPKNPSTALTGPILVVKERFKELPVCDLLLEGLDCLQTRCDVVDVWSGRVAAATRMQELLGLECSNK